MRIALGLEYDGTAFCGWQTQPDGCGVQDHLEQRPRAVRRRAGRGHRGRAHGYRRACDRAGRAFRYRRRARGQRVGARPQQPTCDPRVRVLWAQPGAPMTSTRATAPARAPIATCCWTIPWRPRALHGRVGLVPPAARRARHGAGARESLVGEHDFSAFRDAQCQAKSPVRTLHEARVERARNLVVLHLPRERVPAPHGAQPRGRRWSTWARGASPPGWIAELLADARPHGTPRPPSPPDGLYLAAIEYDPAFAPARLPAAARSLEQP